MPTDKNNAPTVATRAATLLKRTDAAMALLHDNCETSYSLRRPLDPFPGTTNDAAMKAQQTHPLARSVAKVVL